MFGVQTTGRGDITSAMMRLFAAVLIFVSVLGAGLWSAAARADSDDVGSAFFTGIEDFPLMPGLSELPDATLIFDSPSGRFLEAYAVGKLADIDLQQFYGASLPQLGWQETGASTYQREGEALEIIIVGPAAADGTRTIRFAISPLVAGQ